MTIYLLDKIEELIDSVNNEFRFSDSDNDMAYMQGYTDAMYDIKEAIEQKGETDAL